MQHRLAAWLLLGQVVTSVVWLILGGESGPWPGSNAYVVAAFVDTILAVHLFTGARRRVLSFVIARAAFGGLFVAVVAILARNHLDAAAIVATNAAVAFLLTVDSRERTQRIVTSIGALGVAGSVSLGVHHQFLERARAELAESAARGGSVTGKALAYRFDLPPGWTTVEGSRSADVAFTQSSLGALINVYVIPVEKSSACIDTAIAGLIEQRKLIAERALPAFGDRARMLRIRWTEDGQTSQAWAASFLTPQHVIQVLGAAPSSVFEAARADIEHVIESFELPPGTDTLPSQTELTGRWVHGDGDFVLQFPRSWYRRESTKDEPRVALRAFRPYRCVDVMVETQPAPVPFAWEPVEQTLLDAMTRDKEFDVVERKTIGAEAFSLRVSVHSKPHPIEVLARLHRVKGKVVMLRAFAPRAAFDALERELRAILDSFERT